MTEMKAWSEDRRRFPRIAADLDVEVVDGGGATVALGRSRDLSRGGLYVRTDRDVDSGTRCHLRIARHTHPKITAMILRGEVAWTDAEGLGVEFDASDVPLANFVVSLFNADSQQREARRRPRT